MLTWILALVLLRGEMASIIRSTLLLASSRLHRKELFPHNLLQTEVLDREVLLGILHLHDQMLLSLFELPYRSGPRKRIPKVFYTGMPLAKLRKLCLECGLSTKGDKMVSHLKIFALDSSICGDSLYCQHNDGYFPPQSQLNLFLLLSPNL